MGKTGNSHNSFKCQEPCQHEAEWHIKDQVFCTGGISAAAFFLTAKSQDEVS